MLKFTESTEIFNDIKKGIGNYAVDVAIMDGIEAIPDEAFRKSALCTSSSQILSYPSGREPSVVVRSYVCVQIPSQSHLSENLRFWLQLLKKPFFQQETDKSWHEPI